MRRGGGRGNPSGYGNSVLWEDANKLCVYHIEINSDYHVSVNLGDVGSTGRVINLVISRSLTQVVKLLLNNLEVRT